MDLSRFPARLCRRVHFSCAHNWAETGKTPEQNRSTFGPLYAPFAWGHNFILEACFEGPLDPQTQMVVNLRDVDAWLKTVTDPLDHHFLNEDVPYFRDVVPSPENIARYLHRELQKLLTATHSSVKLFKVRLIQDEDLWVDHSELPDVEV